MTYALCGFSNFASIGHTDWRHWDYSSESTTYVSQTWTKSPIRRNLSLFNGPPQWQEYFMHHNPNQNRGFLYGDGFFETMRVVNFTIPLWDLHMERAKRTAEYLEMDWLTGAEIEALRVQIGYGVVSESSILRVDFYRDGTGTYVPDQNNIKTSFDFRPAYFPNASFTLYKQEFEAALNLLPVTPAAIYSKVLKPCNTMSNCKTSSALWVCESRSALKKCASH